METITWTVEYEWSYDEQKIAESVKAILQPYNDITEEDIDNTIREVIEEELSGEDDEIYDGFPRERFPKMIRNIKKKYFVKQLTLF